MRRGAAFRWKSKVVAIECNANGTRVSGVRFEDGSSVEAPIVINVAGPHSPEVHDLAFGPGSNAKVADDSKIGSKPLKVEVAYVPCQEPLASQLDKTMPVVTELDTGVYMRPQQG